MFSGNILLPLTMERLLATITLIAPTNLLLKEIITRIICVPNSSSKKNSYYYQAGMFVDVVLTDLEPDTLYYYKVGNNHSGFTNESTFQTPPIETPEQFSFAGNETNSKFKITNL